jgi:hypothetical protein
MVLKRQISVFDGTLLIPDYENEGGDGVGPETKEKEKTEGGGTRTRKEVE